MIVKQVNPQKKNQTLTVKLLFFLLAFSLFILVDRAAIYLADIFLAGSFKFTWLMAHHVIQIVIALTIMVIPLWRKRLSDWGLNTREGLTTFKILRKFTIGWVFFTTVYTLTTQWVSGWPPLLDFKLNFENILIYLVFESIIVGISEELVFRGLVFGMLERHFRKEIRLPGFSISLAGMIAALFFTLAHVGFQFSPFAITAFEPMQILMAFALGVFYAVLREKTGSLQGPILAHNLSDGWLSVLYLLIEMVKK